MTQPATHGTDLTPDLRDRIIAQVVETVRGVYVFEDVARRMTDHLLQQQQAGSFDSLGTISELTARLTQEMHSVQEDLHLFVGQWVPDPEDDDAAVNYHEAMLRIKERTNYDFRKLEVLLGNVGYLDLRSFCTAQMAGPTATAAMQFLAHCDALIFDMRDNGGGGDLLRYLQSYLFAEPTHMVTQRYRGGRIEQVWTHPYVPGPRFVDHPVFVLTSRSTFSAGEAFAFTLQARERATIIGETTRGGAHPVEFANFPELGIELMIPNAYSEEPTTGANWEDDGVVPNVVVKAEHALTVAHEKALLALIGRDKSDDEMKAFREWALRSVQAQADRPQLAPDQLSIYTGRYGQSLEIGLDAGKLSLTWSGHRDYILTPIAEHEFELDRGTQRVHFIVENGTTSAIEGTSDRGEDWRLVRQA